MDGSRSTRSEHWLLFSYTVPREPSTHRVAVWRRLRDLGALYLQPSVCVVPDGPRARHEIEAVQTLVRACGGTERMFAFQPADEEGATRLRDDFQALRAAEYGEFEEQVRRLLDELQRETAAEKFTFAELDENERDLEKLERWLKRIGERDVLDCPARVSAFALLERGRQALEVFRTKTEQREVGDAT